MKDQESSLINHTNKEGQNKANTNGVNDLLQDEDQTECEIQNKFDEVTLVRKDSTSHKKTSSVNSLVLYNEVQPIADRKEPT